VDVSSVVIPITKEADQILKEKTWKEKRYFGEAKKRKKLNEGNSTMRRMDGKKNCRKKEGREVV